MALGGDGGVAPYVLHGVAASGLGKARGFTQLPWASEQFARKLNLRPSSGTFNVRLADDDNRSRWEALKREAGIEIAPPEAGSCVARCYPVMVNERIRGAIILPHVPGYPEDQVEVLAEQSIRAALNLQDGDQVTLRVRVAP